MTEIQVYVKKLSGETMEFTMKDNQTILDLKKMIEQNGGDETCYQKIALPKNKIKDAQDNSKIIEFQFSKENPFFVTFRHSG